MNTIGSQLSIDGLLTTIFLFLPLTFAFICLYYTFYYLKSVRSMQDIPLSKIRSAAQGFVELSGTTKALLSPPMLGLLTQKPCAWYCYTIEYFSTTRNEAGEMISSWNALEKGISSDPFILNDGTGECVILPLNAEIIAPGATIWRGHTRIPSPPTSSFIRWLLWDNWGQYRYTEQRIELDASIYVRGSFYTWNKENPKIKSNPLLNAYCEEKNLTTLNILLEQELTDNQRFIVSTIPQSRLIRQFNTKSLIFFIAFIFFATLMVNNTYPVVKKALSSWHLK
jgi:hypothetical protein